MGSLNIIQENLSETEHLIFSRLDDVAEIMLKHGVSVKTHTQKALKKFLNSNDAKKAEILGRLTTLRTILSDVEVLNKKSGINHPEKALVERSLEFFNLKLKHEEFWGEITKDEIIEIYNADDIQIFRTLNFFKTSSYSLMDLLVHEWFQLWERPSTVIEDMLGVVRKVKSGEITGVSDCNVKNHIFKEIYDAGDVLNFQMRSSLIQFGVICPLYSSENDNQFSGFMVSSSVKPVTLGEHTKKLSFI